MNYENIDSVPDNLILSNHTSHHVAIIGGGPSGLSCALWCKKLGLIPDIIEQTEQIGGTPSSLNRLNSWFLGKKELRHNQFASEISKHIKDEQINIIDNAIITSIERISDYNFIITSSQNNKTNTQQVSAVVIATGISPKRDEHHLFLGYSKYSNFVCHNPLGHLDQVNHEHKKYLVIGGSDNAFFTANDLVNKGATIYLISRSIPRAQSQIQSVINKHVQSGKVKPYQGEWIGINPLENKYETIIRVNGKTYSLFVEKVYLRIGYKPNLDKVLPTIKCLDLKTNSHGFPELDPSGRWTNDGIYCAGDLNYHRIPCVVSALATGAEIARIIEKDLR